MYVCRIERHSRPNFATNICDYDLVTFVVRYPRVVLAEAATHRMNADTWNDSMCSRTMPSDVSKNSASSRAIPLKRFRDTVLEDPYIPDWTGSKSGMQGDPLSEEKRNLAENEWRNLLGHAVRTHEALEALGVHKQDANRVLEPFAWVTQIITSRMWSNFFSLRCDEYAHPSIRYLARLMYLKFRKSTPDILKYGQWHLPFVPREESAKFICLPYELAGISAQSFPSQLAYSVARCAWVSYDNPNRDSSEQAARATFQKLYESRPLHASPFEHQATPYCSGVGHYTSGNLPCWGQLRKFLEAESVTRYTPSDDEVNSWGITEEELEACEG